MTKWLISLGLFIPTILFLGFFTFQSAVTARCDTLSANDAIAACNDTLKYQWLLPGRVLDVKKRIATLQISAGLYADAIPHLDDVINSNAASYYDYYNRGVAYSWLNDFKSAVADYEIAYNLRPANTDSFQDYIISLNETKDHAKAETIVLKHIAEVSDSALSQRLLAEIYSYQNKTTEALQAAKSAVKIDATDAESQSMLGLAHENANAYEPALAAYSEAIRLQPENTKFLRYRAILHRNMENFEAAKQDYTSLVATEKNINNLTGLALSHIDLLQTAEALPLIVEAEAIDYRDPLSSHTRGRYFVAIGKNDAARDLFHYTLKNDPEFNIAKYWLAVSLYNLSDFEKALEILSALEANWPENSAIRADQSDSLYELGRYKEALAKAEAAVKLNPKSNLAFNSRARAHSALEQWEMANADATTAISLFAENAQSYYDRAYSRWQLSQFAEAQQDYDKAIELAPKSLVYAVERAEFMFFDGKIEEARAVIKKLDDEKKSSPQLTRMKGRLADFDGNFEEAVKLYKIAQRENPNMLWVTEDIAYAQIANDQPALALLTCEEMLQKLPKAAASHRCFAKAHIRMSKYDDALTALDKALAMDPKFWAAHLDKAYTLLDTQDYEASLEVFGKLVKEKYRLPTVYYNRGYAYERLKQNPLAIKDYEAALAIADPNLAKSISASLNSLRAKQPTLRRLEEDPSPQVMFRR